MHRVRLIHWNAAEAEERAQRLASEGYAVAFESFSRAVRRSLREDPPDALVIDLGRLPSQGRDGAVTLRQYKATRQVPLVFVDGHPYKVDHIQEVLPDATYTSWSEISAALAGAISAPPAEPVVLQSAFKVVYATHKPVRRVWS